MKFSGFIRNIIDFSESLKQIEAPRRTLQPSRFLKNRSVLDSRIITKSRPLRKKMGRYQQNRPYTLESVDSRVF